MAIGGFSGQGGNLSLAQFEAYVKAGDIHYYIASGSGFGGGAAVAGPGRRRRPGGPSTSEITSWVKAHYRSETIGGQTVYDLTPLRHRRAHAARGVTGCHAANGGRAIAHARHARHASHKGP